MKISTWIILNIIGFGILCYAESKPNFVFIIADDCTFRDIGCYGGQAHTSNIDKLATEGMKMTRCFQAAPLCSPTRHNICTGLYPVKTGAYPHNTYAKKGTKSIVHYLNPLGYRVALSGKAHVNPKEVFPFEFSGKNNPDMKAINTFLGECAENRTPFCLFACSNEPHVPWNKGDPSQYDAEEINLPPYIPDTPYVRQKLTRYFAEITYFDDQVGQILDLLDKHKLADNTFVMVVSEQGNSMPFAKWTCYDAGLGSIMITRWPGKIKPDTVSDALVEYIDIAPTFIETAGGIPTDVLEGKSMLPVLLGITKIHKQYTYGIMTILGSHEDSKPYPIRSVRDLEYRLIWNLLPEATFNCPFTNSKAFQSMLEAAEAGDRHAKKYTYKYLHRPKFELYDVIADPYNLHNLAGDPKYNDTIKKLKSKLDNWMVQQGDLGIPTELDAKDHQVNTDS